MVCSALGRRILLAVLLLLLSLSLVGCGGGGGGSTQTSASGRSSTSVGLNRSIRINNIDNWFFSSDETSDRSRIVQTLAQRESVCFTELWQVTPQEIKAINPQAKVYRIYDLMVKNDWDPDWKDPSDTSKMQTPLTKATIDANDWWLRDGDGNIVKESEYQWMLDVGKPGFKEAFLEAVLQRMQGKGFDGVVLDYWWFKLGGIGFANGYFMNKPRPSAYPTDADWYEKAWKPFVQYVTNGIRSQGYRIIGNCVGEYNTSYPEQRFQRSLVDGVIYEQFAIDWPQLGAGWLPGNVIEQRIDSFAKDPLEVWADDYGLERNVHQFEQKRLVALAMYYVAIPMTQEKRSYHYINNRKVFWDPLWDFFIGTPSEMAVKKGGKYFWSRRYSQGMVLLNYESSEEISFTLDRTYKDSQGRKYSGTVTLEPHTALVLAVYGS